MRFSVAIFCVLSYANINGQIDPPTEFDLERLADDIFPGQDLDLNYGELYENLAQILSNPLNLNSVTEEQLRLLYVLDENQINEFFKYRAMQGKFISIYELQVIPGFDLGTIDKLTPFITIREEGESVRSLLDRVAQERNNYFLIRYERTVEKKRGYRSDATNSTKYIGSPDRLYSRFRVARSNDFSFGFTLEKDAGESFAFSSKQLGFDYTSIHAQLQNKGAFKNLIVGDYQAQFGQGLVLGGGFGVGKGAEPITTVRRSNIGFLPYTSLTESGFFRGLSLTISPKQNIDVSGFISRTGRDGNSIADSIGVALSSLSITGLHRTQSELENKKSANETNYGVIFSYKKRPLQIGAIFHGDTI